MRLTRIQLFINKVERTTKNARWGVAKTPELIRTVLWAGEPKIARTDDQTYPKIMVHPDLPQLPSTVELINLRSEIHGQHRLIGSNTAANATSAARRVAVVGFWLQVVLSIPAKTKNRDVTDLLYALFRRLTLWWTGPNSTSNLEDRNWRKLDELQQSPKCK